MNYTILFFVVGFFGLIIYAGINFMRKPSEQKKQYFKITKTKVILLLVGVILIPVLAFGLIVSLTGLTGMTALSEAQKYLNTKYGHSDTRRVILDNNLSETSDPNSGFFDVFYSDSGKTGALKIHYQKVDGETQFRIEEIPK